MATKHTSLGGEVPKPRRRRKDDPNQLSIRAVKTGEDGIAVHLDLGEANEVDVARTARKKSDPPDGTPKPKREIPQEVRDRWNRGNAFNKDREPIYTDKGGGNELTLDNGKRVDSYVPGKEIVSRKHTQLGEVQEGTAIKYLQELDNKYSPGATVKDTPHARDQIGDHAGTPLRGDPILEIPPQDGPVPKAVLDEAERLGITIRDSNGKVYP